MENTPDAMNERHPILNHPPTGEVAPLNGWITARELGWCPRLSTDARAILEGHLVGAAQKGKRTTVTVHQADLDCVARIADRCGWTRGKVVEVAIEVLDALTKQANEG